MAVAGPHPVKVVCAAHGLAALVLEQGHLPRGLAALDHLGRALRDLLLAGGPARAGAAPLLLLPPVGCRAGRGRAAPLRPAAHLQRRMTWTLHTLGPSLRAPGCAILLRGLSGRAALRGGRRASRRAPRALQGRSAVWGRLRDRPVLAEVEPRAAHPCCAPLPPAPFSLLVFACHLLILSSKSAAPGASPQPVRPGEG